MRGALAPECQKLDEIQGLACQKQQGRPAVQGQVGQNGQGDHPGQNKCDAVDQSPSGLSQKPPHRCGHVGHAAGKAPFIIIPRQHAHGAATNHFGLIRGENARLRRMIEVD